MYNNMEADNDTIKYKRQQAYKSQYRVTYGRLSISDDTQKQMRTLLHTTDSNVYN